MYCPICVYMWHICTQLFIGLKKGLISTPHEFSPSHPSHTCISIHMTMQACKLVNTYSCLTHTHPHLVTGQTSRQCHEIFSYLMQPCVEHMRHSELISAQSASQQLPDFLLTPFDGSIFFETKET